MTDKWTSDISHWECGVTEMWRSHTLMKILTAFSDASLDHEYGYEYLLLMSDFTKDCFY